MTESTDAVSTEGFIAAIASFSATAAIPSSEIGLIIEGALISAYRRNFGTDSDVAAQVDIAAGVLRLYRIEPDGSETDVAVVGDFARQAAHAVRSAVAVRIREDAKDFVVRDAHALRDQLLDGIVERNRGAMVTLRVGDHMALLPPEEQLAGEHLELHKHVKVVLIDARRRAQDAVLVVSRSHPMLLQLLLEQEVPEILLGQVQIRGIVREPGKRSKVAVTAVAPGIDARGACIGPRGIRHRAVTGELGDEQVQYVVWSEDPAAYVADALAPATVTSVDIDTETRTAHVRVRPDHLSLAIGKSGDNARLVARLTGWRIDIHAERDVSSDRDVADNQGTPAADASYRPKSEPSGG